MKTWWQRKTVGIEVVMMWVLGILVVSVFVLWATAGRTQTYYNCTGSVFDIPKPNDPRCTPITKGLASHLSDTNDGGEPFPQRGPDLRAKNFETQLQCDISPSQALCNTDPAYQDHICRNRMEEAMRAMDEFTYQGELVTTEAVHRSPQAELRLEIERLNRRDAAKQQWESVKKECWSKP